MSRPSETVSRSVLSGISLLTLAFFVPMAAGCDGPRAATGQATIALTTTAPDQDGAYEHQVSASAVQLETESRAILRHFSVANSDNPAALVAGDGFEIPLANGRKVIVSREGLSFHGQAVGSALGPIALQWTDDYRILDILSDEASPVIVATLDLGDLDPEGAKAVIGGVAVQLFGSAYRFAGTDHEADVGATRDAFIEWALITTFIVVAALAALWALHKVVAGLYDRVAATTCTDRCFDHGGLPKTIHVQTDAKGKYIMCGDGTTRCSLQ